MLCYSCKPEHPLPPAPINPYRHEHQKMAKPAQSPYRKNRKAIDVPPEPTDSLFTIAYAEDWNYPKRLSMEDAHDCIYDFNGLKGQGYFAIFDGHAGPEVAQWAGKHFKDVIFLCFQ